MASILNPYLGFKNDARQAMEFYQTVFGGELNVSSFGDYQASEDPAQQDLVMHGQLTTANGFTLMGSDTPDSLDYQPGTNFSVSLSGDDDSELRGYWEKLSDGGTVLEPLVEAPWGDSFGMCIDKFGVRWMVNIAGASSE
jgi:PhnB protein